MRETRLRTRARARIRRPVNPSRAETISPWKTGFSAPYPGVLPRRRPHRPRFCLVGGPFPGKIGRKTRPRGRTAAENPAFPAGSGPCRPTHSPVSAAAVCFRRRIGPGFRRARGRLPGSPHRRPDTRPGFPPGGPGSGPSDTPPRGDRPPPPGLRPAPAQTSALCSGEGLCDPQGGSNPWALRLETAAHSRVKFREIRPPGV